MSGASVGAKHGIVFKTAASLQSIGTLHTAVLDKAGTITNGAPEVVTIVGTRSCLLYTSRGRAWNPPARIGAACPPGG